MENRILTAESVTSGHPDKFCDLVSDMALDECLRQDENSRVACETFATKGLVVVGGEITTKAELDYPKIVREAAARVGYNLTGTELTVAVHEQSPDIDGAVSGAGQGAGDQGIMVGYATDETLSFMPLAYEYARKLTDRLEALRKSGGILGIGSDGKSQVSAAFKGGSFERFTKIVVSVQHDADKDTTALRAEIAEKVIGSVFAEFDLTDTEILINPSGRFVIGGIDADTGLTGRKIVADAYGPAVPVGGGAFSGKDASKVDRSGAYAARWAAKNVVAAGLATRCEIQLAYAIGKAEPLAVNIDTFGTGKVSDNELKDAVLKVFDFRPAEIIRRLDLLKPVYAQTSSGGHFGREGFAWERTDRVEELKAQIHGGGNG
jgi:S-adenosylmethionine synthetase